jgi:hemerythrin
MAWLAWDESFGVGNPLLDSDHRILFNLLDQLNDAADTGQSKDVIVSVLSVLAEYVEHHFRREEAILAATGFPDLDGHKGLHRELEVQVIELRDRYRSGERAVINQNVIELLKNWLTKHILVSDNSYRPWIEHGGGDREPLELGRGDGV